MDPLTLAPRHLGSVFYACFGNGAVSQTDAKMVKSAKINKSKELCYIQCVLVKCVYTTLLKGQVRSRISLFSKRKRNFSLQNGVKMKKIG